MRERITAHCLKRFAMARPDGRRPGRQQGGGSMSRRAFPVCSATAGTRARTILLAAALLLLGTLPAQAQRDRVNPVSGGPATGTITSVSPTEVVIEVRGSARRFAVNEIASVSFTEDPNELGTARTRALAGQYEEALTLLNRIPADSLRRDLVRADWEYYRAYSLANMSLAGGGDKNAAAKSLIDFLAARPQSHHHFSATELVGRVAFAMNRHSSASDYFQKLAAAPWPETRIRAQVLQARSLVAQQKFDEALQQYDAVIANPIDTVEANREKVLARIGRAECLAETGKPDEGQGIVESVIRDNDAQDGRLFARAYNTLGICHLRADRPKEALLAFLHVDLLFPNNPEEHAQALYHLGQLWTTVGKSDRAVAARSLLKSRYSGTSWASK
jgi:tetratricopeptide (TPR) repeat protein